LNDSSLEDHRLRDEKGRNTGYLFIPALKGKTQPHIPKDRKKKGVFPSIKKGRVGSTSETHRKTIREKAQWVLFYRKEQGPEEGIVRERGQSSFEGRNVKIRRRTSQGEQRKGKKEVWKQEVLPEKNENGGILNLVVRGNIGSALGELIEKNGGGRMTHRPNYLAKNQIKTQYR